MLKEYIAYYNNLKKQKKITEKKLNKNTSVRELDNIILETKKIDRDIGVTESIIVYFKKVKRTGERDPLTEGVLAMLSQEAKSGKHIY